MSLAEFRGQHNSFNTPWSDDAVCLMTKLWNEGVLAKIIARMLSERFGMRFTKGSVTNKASRMALRPRKGHLEARVSAERRKETMRRWRAKNRDQINEYRRNRWTKIRQAVTPRPFDPSAPRNRTNTLWTSAACAMLTELWAKNLRIEIITNAIVAEFGPVSRRAIINKAHRIGLVSRGQIIGREGHFAWTDEHKERLAELWSTGISATTIAERMQAEFGRPFTRNSILGKARKLNLSNRPCGGRLAETDPIKLAERAERRRAKDRQRKRTPTYRARAAVREKTKYQKKIETRKLAPQVEDFSIPTPQRKSLMELGLHDCRWPVGEPKSDLFFFCGAVAEESRPYCPAHCKRAYIETRSY